jgi:hypothetical protein
MSTTVSKCMVATAENSKNDVTTCAEDTQHVRCVTSPAVATVAVRVVGLLVYTTWTRELSDQSDV